MLPLRSRSAYLLLALAAACSGGSGGGAYGGGAAATATASPTPATSAPAPAAHGGTPLTIQDFLFAPRVLTVRRGTAVTVTNRDSAAHTWTATDGSFTSGALEQGKSFTFTFTKPGTYAFRCSIHPSMTGTVVVTP